LVQETGAGDRREVLRRPSDGVNPDEGRGAALRDIRGILKGNAEEDSRRFAALDTRHSCGGSVFTHLFNWNTTAPTKKKEIFSTAVDSQHI
jgi:molecular chaperone DnaK (HSP70)